MYNIKTYKNGLRLVHNYDNNTQAVTVMFYCLVGNANEDDTNRGIAHLAEHMFFKGTKKRSAKEISLIFDKLGIVNNAYTSNDCTVFFANAMNKDIEIIFDVFSDCFFNSVYAPDLLELEKKAVCSELEMYLDDNKDLLWAKALEVALQGTPYQYPLGGTVESVTKLKQQDLINYRNKYYKTNRLIISVSGNVSQTEVDKLIEKYVLDYEKEDLNPITFKQPPYQIQLDKRFVFEHKDTDQCYCAINFKSLQSPDARSLTLKALNIVWGGLMSSRLFQKVREEKGLVYYIGAISELMSRAGLNGIQFFANKNNTVEVLKTIREAILEAKQNGFTAEELGTAKNVLKTQYTLSNITPNSKAGKGASYLAYNEEAFDLDKEFSKIDALTLDDLNKCFNEFVNFDDLTVAIIAKDNDINANDILLGK